MGEMREWWANVYEAPEPGPHIIGLPKASARQAHEMGRKMLRSYGEAPLYRVHVRLKPEGAPKRYASDRERAGWERDPDKARALAKQGIKFEAELRDRVVLSRLSA